MTQHEDKTPNQENQELKKISFLNIRGMLLSYSNKEEREKILENIQEWEN